MIVLVFSNYDYIYNFFYTGKIQYIRKGKKIQNFVQDISLRREAKPLITSLSMIFGLTAGGCHVDRASFTFSQWNEFLASDDGNGVVLSPKIRSSSPQSLFVMVVTSRETLRSRLQTRSCSRSPLKRYRLGIGETEWFGYRKKATWTLVMEALVMEFRERRNFRG